MDNMSLQYKGLTGSSGETYFKIKNINDPFALIHVLMMHMCIKKSKASLFQYLFCLVLLQNLELYFKLIEFQWCKKM